mgnify:FL=1
MENASKALLMAAGILIAIILISLLVAMYKGVSLFQRQQVSQEDAARIEEFNSFYTKYSGRYVYGTEVITVINQTVNNNYEVNVEVKINSYSYDSKTTNLIKTKDSKIIDDSNREIALNYLNSSNLRNRAFQCTGITYDTTTGKVNSIKFEEKQYST